MVTSNGLIQSLQNLETANRVEDALLSADYEAFNKVDVLAFYGIVELSGSVASLGHKLLAMQIARRLAGVTTVVESLQVIFPEGRLNPSRFGENAFLASQAVRSF